MLESGLYSCLGPVCVEEDTQQESGDQGTREQREKTHKGGRWWSDGWGLAGGCGMGHQRKPRGFREVEKSVAGTVQSALLYCHSPSSSLFRFCSVG